jgi:hypothetical protein
VTHSTVISGPPARRRWPLLAAALAVSLLAGAGLVILQRRVASEGTLVSTASLSPPAAPHLRPMLSAALPAAPELVEPPHTPAQNQAPLLPVPPPVKVAASAKPVRIQALQLPALPALPVLPRPVATSKSLTGSENPFDRRH